MVGAGNSARINSTERANEQPTEVFQRSALVSLAPMVGLLCDYGGEKVPASTTEETQQVHDKSNECAYCVAGLNDTGFCLHCPRGNMLYTKACCSKWEIEIANSEPEAEHCATKSEMTNYTTEVATNNDEANAYMHNA